MSIIFPITQLQREGVVSLPLTVTCAGKPEEGRHLSQVSRPTLPHQSLWPKLSDATSTAVAEHAPAWSTTRRWTAQPPTGSRTHLCSQCNTSVRLVSRHVKVAKGSFYSYLSSCSNERGSWELSLCQFSAYESDSPSLPCQPHFTLNVKLSQQRPLHFIFVSEIHKLAQ